MIRLDSAWGICFACIELSQVRQLRSLTIIYVIFSSCWRHYDVHAAFVSSTFINSMLSFCHPERDALGCDHGMADHMTRTLWNATIWWEKDI